MYTLGKYRKSITEEENQNIKNYLKVIFWKVFQVDLWTTQIPKST